MRNSLMTAVLLACLTGLCAAADQNNSAQTQSNQDQQTQVAQTHDEQCPDSMVSTKCNCIEKSENEKKPTAQKGVEGDPQAPQNQVEYGGGG